MEGEAEVSLSRRAFLTVLGAAAIAGPAASLPLFKGEAQAFSKDWLKAKAKEMARAPFTPVRQIPKAWRDLSYDQYRSIWFNEQNALWGDTDRPFKLDFFHPGLYFPQAVEMNIVEDGKARALAFDFSLFDKTDQVPELPLDDTLGYSGFRLRTELRKPGIFEEFLVFQGASYFRAIGTGQNYGLSARGLALNTGDSDGEEFPEFTHFYVEAADPGDRMTRVHALLDSPSITGAYSFEITPGMPAKMRVACTLYPRVDCEHVGLAPLTSMFLFDETNRTRFDDFRSAVHDSEGLMVWNGAGELLWRPLANPRQLEISSFVDNGPRGFGLMQRNRRSEDYADLEAHYHNRPSLWITPLEDWGKGSVTLVEIPAEKEIYDNIVAYWRPREVMPKGSEQSFNYMMEWGDAPQRPRDVAAVINTRIGKGYDKAVPYQIITVDFAKHANFAEDEMLEEVTKFISSNRGRVSEGVLQRNPGTGGVRLAFKFDPGRAKQAEMRVQLVKDGVSLTEVWLYRWTA